MPDGAPRPKLPASPPKEAGALGRLIDELPAILSDLIATGTPQNLASARHGAKAIRDLARKAKLSRKAQDTAAEFTLRFERRLGEILPEYLRLGRPKKVPSGNHFRLDDLGIAKKLSMRSQQIAAIPVRVFESYFIEARAAGVEITAGGPTGLLHWACPDVNEFARYSRTMGEWTGGADYALLPPGLSDMGSDDPGPGGFNKSGYFSGPDRARLDAGSGYYFNDARMRRGNLQASAIASSSRVQPTPSDMAASTTPSVRLYRGDCLDVMAAEIADHTAHMILCDLPYGKIHQSWNRPLDLARVWEQYRRIIRPNHTIVLFGSQPYTTDLINSQREMFKQEMIWVKNRAADFVHANNRSMRKHENILVFSTGAIAAESHSSRRMPYHGQRGGGWPLPVVSYRFPIGWGAVASDAEASRAAPLADRIVHPARSGRARLVHGIRVDGCGRAPIRPQLHRHREASAFL
jgi:hypothetical protein